LIYINGLLIVCHWNLDFSEITLSDYNQYAYGRISCYCYNGCLQNFPIFYRLKTIVYNRDLEYIPEVFIHETLHPILMNILFEDGLFENSSEQEHFAIRELLRS